MTFSHPGSIGLLLLIVAAPPVGASETGYYFRAVPSVILGHATPDNTPLPEFAIPSIESADPHTLVQSGILSPAGDFRTVTVRIEGVDGGISLDGGTTWDQSVQLGAGQSLQVRQRAGDFGRNRIAEVIVDGGSSFPFSVTTRLEDTIPDGFSFHLVTDALAGRPTVWPPFRTSGHDPVPITAEGHPSAAYRICPDETCAGVPWMQDTAIVSEGQWIQVRLTPTRDGELVAGRLNVGSASATFEVETGSLPTIASLPADPLIRGQFRSFDFAADGGTEPYAWSVAAGDLPSGLDLSEAGVLSGTPTSVDPYPFTVRVVDSKGRRSELEMTLVVHYGEAVIASVSPPPILSGEEVAFAYRLEDDRPGVRWVLKSGQLPPGITVMQDGTVSGMLAVTQTTYPRTFPFVVEARMPDGTTVERSDSMEVSVDVGRPYPFTDNNWVRGISRRAAGFFTANSPSSRDLYVPGRTLTFADGETRTILRAEQNGIFLNVYFTGNPLDGELVGYPRQLRVE